MNNLEQLAKLIRYYILVSTTEAGSGHPTSSLSATDLMTVLLFGGFYKFDLDNPHNPSNDRLLFSKGHASPLFYSLYAAAGKLSEQELKTLRKFDSPLEGHPTLAFPYTEAATGSLGQGLAVGEGMAIFSKYIKQNNFCTYVLLGDSEMAEGSVWEAIQSAAHYKLNNLIGILDVNRLGQRGETMYGHDVTAYEARISSFGWKTIVINGHSLDEITHAFTQAALSSDKPVMIIAKTIKGKGVSFIEDKDNWHGKALSKDELTQALQELGDVDTSLIGSVAPPAARENSSESVYQNKQVTFTEYQQDQKVATRKAYGHALVNIFPAHPNIVVLDAETSNSTFAEEFKKAHPDRFFEMYISEQNMVGVAGGLARRGQIPFVSTFAAFFSRAFDQVRMSRYSEANIKFVGSHAGVSIGEDGISQMGLEDLSMFRSIFESVVLYPSDAVSTERLVEAAAKHKGVVYICTTRKDTPMLYSASEQFPIGGSKVLKKSENDVVTVVGAGVTLHEALQAHEELAKENIYIRVIDLYSVKPLDVGTLKTSLKETKALITVEDHYASGGIGEAVASSLVNSGKPVHSLAVTKLPKSGKPEELLEYEEISAKAIIKKVKELL